MVRRVRITGFKSLADVEVRPGPLMVRFGPNAAGKSNFLDALQLLAGIATRDRVAEAFEPPYRGTPLQSFGFDGAGIEGLLEQETVSFTLEVDVELSREVIEQV